jgi:hypothetical protein
MRYAAEIYIVQKIPLHGFPPTAQAVPHVDQQVSINRFFGQALARLVSYVHSEEESLPGAQVVMLGSL